MELIKDYDPERVIVVGTAGSLNLKPGLYRPGWTSQWDAASLDPLVHSSVSPPELLPIPGGTDSIHITTGDRFVDSPQLAAELRGRGANLVDMETYVYTYILSSYGVPFEVLKDVTDSADENAAASWEASVAKSSETLWQATQQILEKG